jgi:hypothetical protein
VTQTSRTNAKSCDTPVVSGLDVFHSDKPCIFLNAYLKSDVYFASEVHVNNHHGYRFQGHHRDGSAA